MAIQLCAGLQRSTSHNACYKPHSMPKYAFLNWSLHGLGSVSVSLSVSLSVPAAVSGLCLRPCLSLSASVSLFVFVSAPCPCVCVCVSVRVCLSVGLSVCLRPCLCLCLCFGLSSVFSCCPLVALSGFVCGCGVGLVCVRGCSSVSCSCPVFWCFVLHVNSFAHASCIIFNEICLTATCYCRLV